MTPWASWAKMQVSLRPFKKLIYVKVISVRQFGTGTPQWKPPKYKDKMVVICNILERRCHTYLTVPTIIRDIADWFLFRNGSLPPSPLSVLVRMRNMDDIFKLDFIDCYDRMNELYDLEMAKERRKRKLKNSMIISRS